MLVFKLISPLKVIKLLNDGEYEELYENGSNGLQEAILGLLNRYRFSIPPDNEFQFMPHSGELQKGLMAWYNRDKGHNNPTVNGICGDIVKRCIPFAFPTVEMIDGKIMGVCYCGFNANNRTPLEVAEFNDKYHQELLNKLIDYVSGQYSDGWGEGLEQKNFLFNEDELCVEFWQEYMNIDVVGFDIVNNNYSNRNISEYLELLDNNCSACNTKKASDLTTLIDKLSDIELSVFKRALKERLSDDEIYKTTHCKKCKFHNCSSKSTEIYNCKYYKDVWMGTLTGIQNTNNKEGDFYEEKGSSEKGI